VLVVIERELLRAVSNTVWVVLKCCDYGEDNKREMKWIKTIFTIITI